MKTALITGTSSGIGLSAAILFAKEGFDVTATVRNERGENAVRERASLENVQITVIRMDVTDDDSVRAGVAATLDRAGRIDVLVNNAGAGYLGSTEQTPLEDVRRVMDVNFYGVWRVTQAVLPAMREVGGGRVLSVSSAGGVIGQPFNDAYCAAKFALEGMMESLAPVAERFGVHVSLIEPGPVHTAFLENVGGRDKITVQDAYTPLVGAYVNAIQAAFAGAGQTPDEVARVILEAASAERPHLRYQTSDVLRARVAAKLTDPTGDSIRAAMGAMLGPKGDG